MSKLKRENLETAPYNLNMGDINNTSASTQENLEEMRSKTKRLRPPPHPKKNYPRRSIREWYGVFLSFPLGPPNEGEPN